MKFLCLYSAGVPSLYNIKKIKDEKLKNSSDIPHDISIHQLTAMSSTHRTTISNFFR